MNIRYSQVCSHAENEKYKAYLAFRVINIVAKKTEKKTKIELPFVSQEFAMSSKYIYVLERGDNITSADATLHKYNLKGNLVDTWDMKGINHVYYSDNRLFFQYWLEGDEGTPNILQNGMIVNSYIEEKNFGGKMKKMKSKAGVCKVGTTTFYWHSAGYFSTFKEYKQYPGVSGARLDESNDVISQQENINQKLIKEHLGFNEDHYCEYREYQDMENAFGVYIEWKREHKFRQNYSIPLNRIVKAYTYKINMEKNELTVLDEFDKECPLVTTNDFCVYWEDGKLVKKVYSTQEESILEELKDGDYTISLQNQYMQIWEGEYEKFLKWK